MTHIRTKLVIAGVILAAALGYLAFAGVKKGWVYYLQVDAFLADKQFQDQRVRLCGTVAEDGFQMNAGLLTAKFSLAGEKGRLPVVYKGSMPDMFKPGAQVVAEGQMNQAGTFECDMLMTKCASKYEEKPKDHPGH
jgi:cytochrome c-type biogenesis protein CcmE